MIYVGIPCYNSQIFSEAYKAILVSAKKIYTIDTLSYSALTHTYNLLYCKALSARKNGVTHFLMLHNDIIPEYGFIDKMLAIAERHKADILSAVVPLKNATGCTSIALDTGAYWQPKRLTLKELYKDYEPTFTHEKLLINTGCMLIDITKPFAEKMCFRFENIIEKVGDEFIPKIFPEDWILSREARENGASIYATREIKLNHVGNSYFGNTTPWGQWEKDEHS